MKTERTHGPDLGEAWWSVLAWIDADDASSIRAADFGWIRPVLRGHGELGRTPLMLAAWHGKIGAFNALLEQGASLSDVDDEGVSAQEYVHKFGFGRAEGRLRMSVRLALVRHAAESARQGAEEANPSEAPTPARPRRTPPL